MSPFIIFSHSKPPPPAPKITKLQKLDNNNTPTTTRRKRRRLEMIDTALDAEKDRQELAQLVDYARIWNCGAQNALNRFTYLDGSKSSRNLTIRQVEHAIMYVTVPFYLRFFPMYFVHVCLCMHDIT